MKDPIEYLTVANSNDELFTTINVYNLGLDFDKESINPLIKSLNSAFSEMQQAGLMAKGYIVRLPKEY